jgi:phosphoglycolate phosphatase-like HAD superfamily hydrolase
MAPRRPPDILRKSHAHTDGKPRARDKAELRDALAASVTPDSGRRGLLIDLDGVVYCADVPIPGAADTVRWLRAEGIPHRFVANGTSQSRAALVGKLAAFGIEVAASDILVPLETPAATGRGRHRDQNRDQNRGQNRGQNRERSLPAAPTVLTPAFFAAALSALGTDAGATWMIGDDIRTDVGAARAAGLNGILVRTGNYRPGDLDLGIEPALVLESFGELPGAWS